jgi:hypothetical protein
MLDANIFTNTGIQKFSRLYDGENLNTIFVIWGFLCPNAASPTG